MLELKVLLVGVGGIGTRIAELLVRTGVGSLHVMDGDVVAQTDLHRQSLYYPEDATGGAVKIAAALRELSRIGGRTRLVACAETLTARNAGTVLDGDIDLIIDATDSLATRALINREAFVRGIPWIYTAAIASEYRGIAFIPAGGPCFACYMPRLPAPSSIETCETAGVLPAAAAAAAVFAVGETHRYCAGDTSRAPLERTLLRGDVLRGSVEHAILEADPACSVCSAHAAAERREGCAVVGLQRICGGDRWEAWLRIPADQAQTSLARWSGGDARLERGGGFWRSRRGDESVLVFDDRRVLFLGSEAEVGDTGSEVRANAVRGRLAQIFGPDALDPRGGDPREP